MNTNIANQYLIEKMKIRKRLAKALDLSEKEKKYALSLNSKKYCVISFVTKIIIILASIFLPIIYINSVSAENFLPVRVFEVAKSSNFLLYKSNWMSHIIAMFVIVPSLLMAMFYISIKPFKNFASYVALKSFTIYSFNPVKLFAKSSSETLKDKINILHNKFIKISFVFFLSSSIVWALLLVLDMHNYTVITGDGVYYRSYGKLQERQLKWQDTSFTSSGCNYIFSSYRNTFVRMKWYYKLHFNNGLILDLHDFDSLQKNKLLAFFTIRNITNAIEVPHKKNKKTMVFF